MFHRKYAFIFALLITLALAACGGANVATTGPEATATLSGEQTASGPVTPIATQEATPPEATVAAPTELPATEPPPPATMEPAVLCPELPRPALVLSTGQGFEAHDPLSGVRCALSLPETLGYLQPGSDRLYFALFDHEGGNSVVARLTPDGVIEPLEGTRAEGDVHYLMRFAVSADESRLAWTAMRPQDDPNATALLGSLWVGAIEGSEPVTILADTPGSEMRIITPVRFSVDGSTLFYSWEPIGLGGMWVGFNGRWDNLYRVPVAGGESQKVFDCADVGGFLCIGDFLDDGSVAYTDTEKAIHVLGPDGAELAMIPTTSDYAGYPTFSPTSDLIYSEAMLSDDLEAMPLPSPGTIYRVTAPYSGAPVVVASADGLLVSAPRPFLDNEHVVVSYLIDGTWGTALLSLDGEITPLEPWPNAYLAAIWPAN